MKNRYRPETHLNLHDHRRYIPKRRENLLFKEEANNLPSRTNRPEQIKQDFSDELLTFVEDPEFFLNFYKAYGVSIERESGQPILINKPLYDAYGISVDNDPSDPRHPFSTILPDLNTLDRTGWPIHPEENPKDES